MIPAEEASQAPASGWRERTYRQDLLLTVFCHTGPPALYCFLFKKGHKPLRVESVVQLVQGALLGCLGRLGHAVEIQLQRACGREGSFSRGFSTAASLGLPWGWTVPRKLSPPPLGSMG